MSRGRVKVSIVGDEALIRRLKAAGSQGVEAAATGLYQAGEQIRGNAMERAPVDFGVLKGSAYVTLPELKGGDAEVIVGFGGPAKDYAIVQHEDLTYRHPVGEAKFLEKAVDEEAPNIPGIIAMATRQVLA